MTSSYPALDFCRKVRIWQTADQATSGLALIMPESEQIALNDLLRPAGASGPSTSLEARARFWLIGYQAMEAGQRVLDSEQRAELARITTGFPVAVAQARGTRTRTRPRSEGLAIARVIAMTILKAYPICFALIMVIYWIWGA